MRTWLVLGLVASLAGCSSESDSEYGGGDEDSGLSPDAGGGADTDAGSDGGLAACPTEGRGTLALEIESAVPADVRVVDDDGAPIEGDPTTESREVELSAGLYTVSAHRVRAPGDMVGPAYQGVVEGDSEVCVRADETTTVRVVYTREPGSEKLWLTHINGEGHVLAFDADQLAEAGEQEPSVTLNASVTRPTALGVDALGRLWVGDTAGKLVAFATERLGESTDTPDIVLTGPAICGATLPCGPQAIAFDAEGSMWVAVLDRIVKFSANAVAATGQPEAEVTITSPDAPRPKAISFDADGNLWVGEEESFVKFAAERLLADITDEEADVVIVAMDPVGPTISLGGASGLAFDADGNLWAGYDGPNVVARFTPDELAATATLTPTVAFRLGALALPTDLRIDEGGNLWLPGASGTIARVNADQLLADEPEVVTLSAPGVLGSAQKLVLHSVPGPLFIAP